MLRLSAALVVLAAAGAIGPVAAQEIRGRVVDERSRQAIDGVTVGLYAGDTLVDEASTDRTGFYTLRASQPGEYQVLAQAAAYASGSTRVTLSDAALTIPALVLRAEVFELDPIEANARGEQRNIAAETDFSRASHVMAGARLARLESQGGRALTAVRELSGLRVTEYIQFGQPVLCIESRQRMGGMNEGSGCKWVVLVIDGIALGGDPQQTFRGFMLQDYESIELVPPAEAGFRYGSDAGVNGALVLWSRGRGPHVDPSRNR